MLALFLTSEKFAVPCLFITVFHPMPLSDHERHQALLLLFHADAANARLGHALIAAHPEVAAALDWELSIVACLGSDAELGQTIQTELLAQLGQEEWARRAAALALYQIPKRRIYNEAQLDQCIIDHAPYQDILSTILKRHPTWMALYLEVGYWLQHRAKLHFDFALQCYEWVLEAQPEHLVARYELAALHRAHTEDYQAAICCYRTILEQAPNEHRALDLWAMLYLRDLKQYERRAIDLLEQACALAPDQASYHFHLALAHQALDQFEVLEALLEEGVERFPKYVEGLVMAANYWSDEHQNYDKAKALYLKAIKVNPRDVYALGNLAELYAEGLHDYSNAAYYYYQTMRRQLHPYFMTNFITLLVLHLDEWSAGKKYYLKRAELDADQRAEAEQELSEAQLAAYREAEEKLLNWLAAR